MPHLCIVLSNVFVFGAQWELCMGIEASVGGCSSTVNYIANYADYNGDTT